MQFIALLFIWDNLGENPTLLTHPFNRTHAVDTPNGFSNLMLGYQCIAYTRTHASYHGYSIGEHKVDFIN